jgi:ArsR family transcriptional regulator
MVVKNLAQFFKVLGDEARLQMLWLLFNQRELCVCDFTQVLGITQSKASRHLATLRHAGLVMDRKAASWSYYSLHEATNELEGTILDSLRRTLMEHPDAQNLLEELQALKRRKEMNTGCLLHQSPSRPAPRKGKRVASAPAPLSGDHP